MCVLRMSEQEDRPLPLQPLFKSVGAADLLERGSVLFFSHMLINYVTKKEKENERLNKRDKHE